MIAGKLRFRDELSLLGMGIGVSQGGVYLLTYLIVSADGKHDHLYSTTHGTRLWSIGNSLDGNRPRIIPLFGTLFRCGDSHSSGGVVQS
jgi:hypothetical protein